MRVTHIHEREASVCSCPKGLRNPQSLKVLSFLLLQWVPVFYSSPSLSSCYQHDNKAHFSGRVFYIIAGMGTDLASAHKDILPCLPSHVMDRQVFLLFTQALFISVPP